MDRRGVAEMLGAALVSALLAVSGLVVLTGDVNWRLVLALALAALLATAVSYRSRTGPTDAWDAAKRQPAPPSGSRTVDLRDSTDD